MAVRRIAVALGAAAAVAAAAAPGAAAAPVKLADGGLPHVALDAAGTAYIAYSGNEATGVTSLHLCRLPRGAAACDRTTSIPTVGESVTRPFVLVRDGKVRVFSSRFGIADGGTYVHVSTDGGATFPTRDRVSTLTFADAAAGPGNFLSIVTSADPNGLLYQRIALDPPPGLPSSAAVLSGTHVVSSAVGLATPDSPLVIGATLASDAQWRRFSGAGEINTAATWTAPVGLGHGFANRLASGPLGLVRLHDTAAGALAVQRFDGAGFGADVPLPLGTGETPSADLAQDPAGRLHAVWPQIRGDGPHLLYATSDDGAGWAVGDLGTDSGVRGVRAAFAADHVGVAAWDTSGVTAGREVHVVALGPVPPAAPAPPPPSGGGTTTPPATTGVVPAYSGTFRPVTSTDAGGRYRLAVPRGCVQPGQAFRVTLTWKRKKRKGNLAIKLTRTDFYLGTRRLRIDRRAPFVHTFRVVASQRRGSTVSLRARAFIKVRRGKVPKKSIRATVKVCA